jgi:hypothetical protein
MPPVRVASEKFPREILENRDDLGPSSRSLLQDQGSIARIRETLAAGFGHNICPCLCLCRGIGRGIAFDVALALTPPWSPKESPGAWNSVFAITPKPSHRSRDPEETVLKT